MSSARRTTAYVLSLLLVLLFTGCAIDGNTESAVRLPSHGVTIEEGPGFTQAIIRNPLAIAARYVEQNGCTIRYPIVCNADMELLNLSIRTVFSDFAAENGVKGGTVDFSIEFNNYGLVSFLMTSFDRDGGAFFVDAASFNSDNGRRVRLSDCFGSIETDYTSRLRDIVTRYIEANKLTLVSEIPPINDDSLFLFTYDGLFLVYREYELATYDAGMPRIRVKLSNVMDLLAHDGLLNRVS